MKCEDVQTPMKVCDDVPEEVCQDQEHQVTKYVDEKVCHDIIDQECEEVSIEQCEEVKVPVSRKEPKEVCSPKEACNFVSKEVTTYTTEEECEVEYVQKCK